jgi:CubicO group peptidase (beta-lactamase class C family)
MPDTVVDPSAEQAARLAVGHTRRGRPVPRFELPALAGAGALRSTASDMLRFLEAYLDPPRAPLAGPLERIQRRDTRRPGDGDGARLAAGPLARARWPTALAQRLPQLVGVLRERGIAVVVLSNTAWSVDRLGFRLVRALSTAAHVRNPVSGGTGSRRRRGPAR